MSDQKNVVVSTIDDIQGQEKDIIVFSCVPSDGVLLSVPENLTVALTRARKSLYICGNFHTLRRVDLFDKLFQDAKHRSVVVDTTLAESLKLREHLLNVK